MTLPKNSWEISVSINYYNHRSLLYSILLQWNRFFVAVWSIISSARVLVSTLTPLHLNYLPTTFYIYYTFHSYPFYFGFLFVFCRLCIYFFCTVSTKNYLVFCQPRCQCRRRTPPQPSTINYPLYTCQTCLIVGSYKLVFWTHAWSLQVMHA